MKYGWDSSGAHAPFCVAASRKKVDGFGCYAQKFTGGSCVVLRKYVYVGQRWIFRRIVAKKSTWKLV